jgi:hypothetical protein
MWLVFKVNVDLWPKATIRKYLPPEAKDPKKRMDGKMAGDRKKAMLLLVQQNAEGQGARTTLAENYSYEQISKNLRLFTTN